MTVDDLQGPSARDPRSRPDVRHGRACLDAALHARARVAPPRRRARGRPRQRQRNPFRQCPAARRGKRRRRRYRSERGAYRRGECGAERLWPDRFTARTGDVVEDADFLQALAGDGFDIVCANIVADVIIRLAPVVPRLMRPDAAFVCSGILTTREDDVLAALAAAGLEIVHAAHEGEWCGLTARLGGALRCPAFPIAGA